MELLHHVMDLDLGQLFDGSGASEGCILRLLVKFLAIMLNMRES